MALLHPRARLIDARNGEQLSGPQLEAKVDAVARALADVTAGIVIVQAPTAIETIVRYLGAWRAERPVALLDPDLASDTLLEYIHRFQPAVVAGAVAQSVGDRAADEGYVVADHAALGCHWARLSPPGSRPNADLGVMLATSGSTGNPRFVRLSRAAILANTAAIIEVLGILGDDVSISSLPFYYSYGMSVLNTHLSVGASFVVETGGLIQRPFWDAVSEHRVTSLACVPYQFEVLRRLRFDPSRPQSADADAGGRQDEIQTGSATSALGSALQVASSS